MHFIRPRQNRSEQDRPAHRVAVTTDIGRTHRVNQDAGGAWTWAAEPGLPRSLLIVADGVSAAPNSQRASRLAVRVVRDRLEPLLTDPEVALDAIRTGLLAAMSAANAAIVEPVQQAEGEAATTVVAAVCLGGEGIGAWCGDSRAYRIADGRAMLLTHDHSWLEETTRRGSMERAQARNDPRAHMITRWLGPAADRPEIEMFRFQLDPGDSMLLCSDGLSTYFEDEEADELAAIVSRHGRLVQRATASLVSESLRRGGHDNITVALLYRVA